MITQSELKDLVICGIDGLMRHKERKVLSRYDGRFNRQWAGKQIGTNHHTGYLVHTANGKQHQLHRLVFLYHHGYLPHMVDHYDQNKLNNSLSNLVPSNVVHNGRNRRLGKNNTSGYIGVVWDKSRNRWKAQMKINGKQMTIGTFKDKCDAISARLKKEKEVGFCANHGSK